MTHLTDEGIREDIRKRGFEGGEDIDFGCFEASKLRKSVEEDVEKLKGEKMLVDVDVRGFVLVTETGLLEEVAVS
jgi:hypothetical protein